MSFFDRQPPLFDTKKRLGNSSTGTSTPGISSVFGSQIQNQGSNDDTESQTGALESWVELAPSRASLCSSVEAVMIDRDGGDHSSASKNSRSSPVSFQSPHVEFETNLEQVKNKLVKDMLPPGNTDWVWDWSSRPEQFGNNRLLRNRGNVESTLTTPPNSPEPSEFEYGAKSSWPFYRFEVIVGLVVSNLMTFVLGATVGFCICKKIAKNRDAFY